MNTAELICELSSLNAPAGFEYHAAARMAELLRPLVDSVHTDAAGNLVGLLSCGRPDAPRLLLDAHIDEIGFVITGREKGFLRFMPLGGVDPRMLPGAELVILTPEPVFGVVASTPPHLTGDEERDKAIPVSDLYIDIGMDEEGAALIPVGTPAVFAGNASVHGEGSVCGKALDDRAGFAVLLRALELLRGRDFFVDVAVLGSVQEELGLRGAQTGAFALDPDCCVAVDVTFGRTPDDSKEKTFTMGGGPAIGLGPNLNRGLCDRLRSLAKERDIPCQLEVMEGNTGTNGWVIELCRGGVPTALLSVPVKYMHSPVEMLLLADFEHTARLLAEFICSYREGDGFGA